MSYREEFLQLLYTLPAVLLAIMLRQIASRQMSVWMGDETPRRQGRMSLNPLRYIDLTGVICLAVFGFGWARPVQVDPRAYRNPKVGMALTALAGPVMNFLLAFLGCMVYARLFEKGFLFQNKWYVEAIVNFLMVFMSVNIGLGVFNLIPIPPLDGSRILGLVLPERYYFGYMRYERYGLYVLMGIILIENFTQITLLPIGVVKEAIWTWMLDLSAFFVGI